MPRLKFIFSLIGLSLFIVFSTACSELASMDSHSKISRFQHSEDIYRAAMRWEEWNDMFHLMKNKPNSLNKLKKPSEDYLSHLDKIKVREVEVLSSNMEKELGTGFSKFKIGYHLDTALKIHSIRHTVYWWYHKESNTWFTDTPLPKAFDIPKSRTIRLSPKRY